MDGPAHAYRFGGFLLDPRSCELSDAQGRPLALTRRVFDTLLYLVEHPGVVLGRDELLGAVWPDRVVEENNLSQSISALRRALEEEGSQRYILTVPGRGYRFVADVRKVERRTMAAEGDAIERVESTAFRELAASRLALVRAGSTQDVFDPESSPDRNVLAFRAKGTLPTARALTPPTPVVATDAAGEIQAPLLGEAGPTTTAPIEGSSGSRIASVEPATSEARDEVAPDTKAAAASSQGARKWRLRAGAAIAVVALLAIVGERAFESPKSARAGPSIVVIAPFEARTLGDDFGVPLDKALEIDLSQSPSLTVLASAQIHETLRRMKQDPETPVTRTLAGEICARNEGRAVVHGTVSALGSTYLLTLEANECASGRSLVQEKTVATGAEALISSLDDLVGRMRRTLGESDASLSRFGVPLARATTASFDALKAYSKGVDLYGRGQRVESIPFFQHAVELDPEFAAGYADLAAAYYSLNQSDLAAATIAKAYALRDRASERERFFIVASYHRNVTKDLEEQIKNLELWSQTYPFDPSPLISLCNALNFVGRYAQAIEAGQREIELSPRTEATYVVLGRALRRAGRLEEASKVDQQAVAAGLDGDATHGELLQTAFALHDQAGIDRETRWADQHPSQIMFQLQAEMAWSEGRIRAGQELWDRLVSLEAQRGLPDYAAAARARISLELGLEAQAKDTLRRIPANRSVGDYLFTTAEIGDPAVAQEILRHALADTGADVILLSVLAPEARAALELRDHAPLAAVEELRVALPYDLRSFDVPFLRGNAFLQADDGVSAAAEFRKILDHPGVDPVSPLYSLSHLALARALAKQGRKQDAVAEYTTFLGTWRNADGDEPLLVQARLEQQSTRFAPDIAHTAR